MNSTYDQSSLRGYMLKQVEISALQSWTKCWRQIHKFNQNRFFYGMFYIADFFAIFYQIASKIGFWVNGWVLAIKSKYFRDFLEIS